MDARIKIALEGGEPFSAPVHQSAKRSAYIIKCGTRCTSFVQDMATEYTSTASMIWATPGTSCTIGINARGQHSFFFPRAIVALLWLKPAELDEATLDEAMASELVRGDHASKGS